jgi:hypothetical protein
MCVDTNFKNETTDTLADTRPADGRETSQAVRLYRWVQPWAATHTACRAPTLGLKSTAAESWTSAESAPGLAEGENVSRPALPCPALHCTALHISARRRHKWETNDMTTIFPYYIVCDDYTRGGISSIYFNMQCRGLTYVRSATWKQPHKNWHNLYSSRRKTRWNEGR